MSKVGLLIRARESYLLCISFGSKLVQACLTACKPQSSLVYCYPLEDTQTCMPLQAGIWAIVLIYVEITGWR